MGMMRSWVVFCKMVKNLSDFRWLILVGILGILTSDECC